MCGIAGLVNLLGRPIEVSLIKAMTDSIAHRGPDGEGQWVEGAIGLGHRRLAIIDTSSAAGQPMISSNGRFVLIYNGEVYNFKELRQELEQSGVGFITNSDTEVVLEALALWGFRAINRFNGMFAFALWDRKDKILLLARDRYGIKPLYWAMGKGVFAFASENKAILRADRQKRDLDISALHEYLTFQNFFTDRTLLEGIHLLPPGNYATLNLATPSSKLIQTQYWDFDFRSSRDSQSEDGYVDELRHLLQQAVQRQLVSDVEIGTYLSGGIDSGTIASIASRDFSDLKSFTCGFDLSSASGLELGFDERSSAEALSASFKTEHYEMVLKAGDMERCMPSLAWHLEEPRVGQSYPNYYASKLASKFVKVVLAGTGGDELFGGYPWRYFHSAESNSFSEFSDRYYSYWQRLVSEDEISALLAGQGTSLDLKLPRTIFDSVLRHQFESFGAPSDQVNSALYLEAKTFLHGLLVVEDKLSMAHSLECRVPFLDNDLVDFAMASPPNMKVYIPELPFRIDENTPGSKASVLPAGQDAGKRLLREASRAFLPQSAVSAKKQGFSAPDASWFRGESIGYVERRLLGPSSRLSEIMSQRAIADLVGQHTSGKRNRRLLIWSLLSLESWMDLFQ